MKTFRALFEVMDEDGSGTLTLEEPGPYYLRRFILTVLQLLYTVFILLPLILCILQYC